MFGKPAPAATDKLPARHPRRADMSSLGRWFCRHREARRQRISSRLRSRLDNGMIDEVKSLIDSGISPDDLIYYGLEYKFITLHVIGQLSFDEMLAKLEIAIHQFAKRQMTWFRGMERRGFKIHWLPYDLPTDEFVERVKEIAKL